MRSHCFISSVTGSLGRGRAQRWAKESPTIHRVSLLEPSAGLWGSWSNARLRLCADFWPIRSSPVQARTSPPSSPVQTHTDPGQRQLWGWIWRCGRYGMGSRNWALDAKRTDAAFPCDLQRTWKWFHSRTELCYLGWYCHSVFKFM